jgi:hypothetical protein
LASKAKRTLFGQQVVLVRRVSALVTDPERLNLRKLLYHPMFTSGKEDMAFAAMLKHLGEASKADSVKFNAVKIIKSYADSQSMPHGAGLVSNPWLGASRGLISASIAGRATPVCLHDLATEEFPGLDRDIVWDRMVCHILYYYLLKHPATLRDRFLF